MRRLLIAVLALVALVDVQYSTVGARPTSGVERREETIFRRQDVADATAEELPVDTAAVEESIPEETPEVAPETEDTASLDELEETTETKGPDDDLTPAETMNLKDGANVPVDETVPEDVPASTEPEPIKVPAAVPDAPYNSPVSSPVNDPVVPSKGEVSSDQPDDAQLPGAEIDTTPPATTVSKEAQESPERKYAGISAGETSAAEGEYATIAILVDHTDSSLETPASSAPPAANTSLSAPAAAQPTVSAIPDEKEPTPVLKTTGAVPTASEAANSSAGVVPAETPVPVVEVSSKDDIPDATRIAVSTSVPWGTTSSSDVLPPAEPIATPAVPVNPTSLEGSTNPASMDEAINPVPAEETTKSVPAGKATETTSINKTIKHTLDNKTTSSTPISEPTRTTHTSNMEKPKETKTNEYSTAKTSTPTTSTKGIIPANPDEEESTTPKNAPVLGTTKKDTKAGSTKAEEFLTPNTSASKSEEPVSSRKPVKDDTPSGSIAESPTMTDSQTESPTTSMELMSAESQISQTAEPVQTSRTRKLPLNIGGLFPTRVPSTITRDGGLPMTTRPTKAPNDDTAAPGTTNVPSEQTPSPPNNNPSWKPTPVINLGNIISKPIAEATSRAGGVFQSATSVLGNIASQIFEGPRPTRGTGRGGSPTATPRPSLDVESPSGDGDAGSMTALPISEWPTRTRGAGRGNGRGGRPTPTPGSGDAEVPPGDNTDGTMSTTELPFSKPTRTWGTVRGGSPTRTPALPDLGIPTDIVDSIIAALPTLGRPTRTWGTSRGGRPTAVPNAGDVEAPVSVGANGSLSELLLGKPTRTRETGRGGRPTRTPMFPDLGLPTRIIDPITAALPTIPGRTTRMREPSSDGRPTTAEGNPGLELPIGDGTIAISPLLTRQPTRTRGSDRGGRPTPTALIPGLELPTGILVSLTAGLPVPGRPTRSRGTEHGKNPTPTPVIPDLELPIDGGTFTALPIMEGILTAVPTITPGATSGTKRPEVVPFPTIPVGIPQVPTTPGNIPTRLPFPSQGLGDIVTNLPLPPVVTDILGKIPTNVPSSLPILPLPVQIAPQPPVGRPTPTANPLDAQENPAIELPILQQPALPTDVGDGLPRPTGLSTALLVLPSTRPGHVNPLVEGGPQTPKVDFTQQLAVPPTAENPPTLHSAALTTDGRLPNAEPASSPPNEDPPGAQPAPTTKPPTDQIAPGRPQDPISPPTAEKPPAAQPNDATKPAPVLHSAPDPASDDDESQNPAVPALIAEAPSNGEQGSLTKMPTSKPASASQRPAPEGDQSSQDTQGASTDDSSESTFKPLGISDKEKPTKEDEESSERGPIIPPEVTKLDIGSRISEPTLAKDVRDGDIDVSKTQALMAVSSVKTDASEETDAPTSAPADVSSTKVSVMASVPTPTRLDPSHHMDLTTSLSTDGGAETSVSVAETAINSTRTFLATRTHQGLVTAYSKTDAPAAPARTIGAFIGPDGHGIEIVAAGGPVPDIKAALKEQGISYEADASASSVEWRDLVAGVLVAMAFVVV